jgi:hypothetical protein
MALFGSSRDISFFRHINKELINDIIQTEIDFYKPIVSETESNIYGEASEHKSYYIPIRLASLITRDDIVNTTDEMGVDTDQTVTFAFLRDGTLDSIGLVPEIGDVIEWDSKYWEINGININQYILGRNDLTNKTIGAEFGANWSYICKTNLTRRSRLNIERIRFGGKK